jgi:hypothetical protein
MVTSITLSITPANGGDMNPRLTSRAGRRKLFEQRGAASAPPEILIPSRVSTRGSTSTRTGSSTPTSSLVATCTSTDYGTHGGTPVATPST